MHERIYKLEKLIQFGILQICQIHRIFTVSGQNMIGIYIIPLTLIQLIEDEQNLVCNNWWLKLQPSVILQNWSITAGCSSNNRLLQKNFVYYSRGLFEHLIIANNILFINNKLDPFQQYDIYLLCFVH